VKRARALVVACLFSTSCKKQSAGADPSIIAKMTEFRDVMCACADQACADQVQAKVTTWGEQMTKQFGDVKPDPELVKAASEIMTRYSECFAKLTPPKPPPKSPLKQVDALVKIARDHAAKHTKHLVMSKLEATYIRADGTLDPEYGGLEVEFKMRPGPAADDPKRPIGAPVKAPSDGQTDSDCPHWTTRSGAWEAGTTYCMPTYELGPARCSVPQVWARAIRDQAPAAGLASLSLQQLENTTRTQWMFSITDAPRGIDFHRTYPDDCEPVVEQP